MSNVCNYGFFHDKAKANEYFQSTGFSTKNDAAENTWFVQFDGPIVGNALIDIEIDGHTYSVYGTGGPTKHGVYWKLGTSKDNTQFDFVDKKPVSEASVSWPTVTEAPLQTKMTVSTFTGGTETYPTKTTQVNGADGKPIKGISMALTTSSEIKTEIKEDKVTEYNKENNLKGCPFDAQTAQAVHGKKLIVLVTDKTGEKLVGTAGQQGTTFTIEAETTEANTKDGTGEWMTKNVGQKSWNSSVEGLWATDDEGRKIIINALKKGELLCYGLYMREQVEEGTEYTPVRQGLAFVTSDEIEAPADDNVTYSLNFEGTGEVWMLETAQPDELEEMKFTVSDE